MSVRLDVGDFYFGSTPSPPRTSYTICGWAKEFAVGAFHCLCSLEDDVGSAANGVYLGLINSTGLVVFDAGGQQDFADAGDYDDDNWFFFALVGSGTSVTAYARLEGEASLTSLSGLTQAAFTAAAVFIGGDSFDEDLDGEMRYIRIWDAALSSVELQAESESATHVRTADIYGVYPFADTTDEELDISGTGNDLTVFGTPSTGASEPDITVGGGEPPPFEVIGQRTQGLIARQQRYPRR